MPRPFCPRKVGFVPGTTYFKPAGVPMRDLEEVVVALDEIEALRLADLEAMYQEQAAARMNISRPTFARVVEAARRKVADALIHGKALRVEGGAVIMKGEKDMPKKDGTGPARTGHGGGRGPYGQGGRHGHRACRGNRPPTGNSPAGEQPAGNREANP